MPDQTLLTDQNILDGLDAAGYGIGYWAHAAEIDTDARTYTVTEAGDLDPATNEMPVYVLTFDKLRETYWSLVDLDQTLCGPTVHSYFLSSYTDRTQRDGIEMGHIDADAADVWVQVAALSKVVYG